MRAGLHRVPGLSHPGSATSRGLSQLRPSSTVLKEISLRVLGLPFLSRLGDLAPLALRIGVGFVFVSYGSSKLSSGARSSPGC